eukprot:2327469-Rhodomonas_salina.1
MADAAATPRGPSSGAGGNKSGFHLKGGFGLLRKTGSLMAARNVRVVQVDGEQGGPTGIGMTQVDPAKSNTRKHNLRTLCTRNAFACL